MKKLLFRSLAFFLMAILLNSCSDEQGNGTTTIRELSGGNDGSGYTLNISSTNGTVTKSPDKTSYNAGDTVTLTAMPSSGYKFYGWSGDAVGSSLILSIIMDNSKQITAVFQSNSPRTLDTIIIGKWQGAIGAIKIPNTINFNGEKIFVNISSSDSTFALITRDTTRAATPLIFDTTLVLTGSWRLNAPKDSALLLCDTCRIIDTTLNALVPRLVRGQIIPVFVNIARNNDDGYIEWQIALTDFLPIAPLMGLNLNGVDPNLFSGTIIVLAKMLQE
jgi:plastocyanin